MTKNDQNESASRQRRASNSAASRFWNVLTAILYLGSTVIVATGSLIILPIFGLSGLSLFGWTFILCVAALFVIWLFSKISDLFGGL